MVSAVHTLALSSTHGTSQTSKYEVLTPSANVFSTLRILSLILVPVYLLIKVTVLKPDSDQDCDKNSDSRKHTSRRSYAFIFGGLVGTMSTTQGRSMNL